MKPTIALLCSTLAVALAAPPKPNLAQVHKVYLTPMTNGMDQYLANRLTTMGVFQVVTDPKKADAVFTDHLGETFEALESEWFPDPTPTPTPTAAAEKPPSDPPQQAEKADTHGTDRQPLTTFHRTKGTLFLVDARSRAVLWSVYAQPKDTSAVQLDRTATHIVSRIQQDLKGR
jgi:hypothetical protein